MNIAESIADLAAALCRQGKRLPAAIWESLDQHGIFDSNDRGDLYRQVCGILGKRRRRPKKAAHQYRSEGAIKPTPTLLVFHLRQKR